jgi:hypothetical protein
MAEAVFSPTSRRRNLRLWGPKELSRSILRSVSQVEIMGGMDMLAFAISMQSAPNRPFEYLVEHTNTSGTRTAQTFLGPPAKRSRLSKLFPDRTKSSLIRSVVPARRSLPPAKPDAGSSALRLSRLTQRLPQFDFRLASRSQRVSDPCKPYFFERSSRRQVEQWSGIVGNGSINRLRPPEIPH